MSLPLARLLVTLVLPALAPSAGAFQAHRRADFRIPERKIVFAPEQVGSLALGDVDRDGDLELFAAGSRLLAWQHDGTPLAGFPVGGLGGYLALADLDRDPLGDLEVLYTTRTQAVAHLHAHHHVDVDGLPGADPVAGWPAIVHEPFAIFETTFPSVEDLDGDGWPEVTFGLELNEFPNKSASVHLFRHDGVEASGAWPVFVSEHSFRYTAAALGDLDGDGRRELVLNAAQVPWTSTPGQVHAWRVDGQFATGFPAVAGTPNFGSAASPVLADLTGEGRFDVITGVGKALVAVDSSGLELFRHDLAPGRAITPALADLDDDGDAEIVVGVDEGERFHLVVLDREGRFLARTPTLAGRLAPLLSPLVGDLDGDGQQELLVAVQGLWPDRPGRIHVFGRNGAWRPELTMLLPGELFWSLIAMLGDLDGDGDLELVAVGSGRLHIFETRGSPADCDWPMFQHDPHLSGRFE